MLRKAFLVCLIALLSCGFAMAQETKVGGESPQPHDFVLGGQDMICWGQGPATIPDNTPDTGVSTQMTIDCDDNPIAKLEALVQIQHTWVGDLEVTLTGPGGNSAVILDRPGLQPPLPPPGSCCGCSFDNIDAIFGDNGTAAAETMCNPNPAISGNVIGGDPAGPVMAVFDGKNLCGTWTLRVTDGAGADTGTLLDWCLGKEEGEEGQPPGVPATGTWGMIALIGLLLVGSLFFIMRRRAEA